MEIEPPNDVLQAAVDYAKRGVSVFAIATGSKRPHTTFAPHGFRSATTDTAAIERWFERETVTAIATEPGASGCVVLDLDDRHGGYDSIAALQHRLGLLPLTRTAITPGGGEHRWYRLPDGERIASRNAYELGVDAKSTGGYVLLPPSTHPNGGRYEWDASDEDLAALPQAWIDALQNPAPKATTAAGRGDETIPEGGRHKALLSLAGRLRRNGMSAAAIEDALRATNARQCAPPLPQTAVDVLARDVGARYTPANALSSASPNRHDLRVIPATEVVVHRVEWLERDRIPLASLSLLEGQGDLGKTTVALGIIAAATDGRLFFQRDARRDRKLNALVIAEEDDLGHLRAKLAAASADLARVSFVDGAMFADSAEPLILSRDAEPLRRVIEERSATVVYVDALFSHLDLEGEGRMSQQMRRALSPLVAVARETGAAIIATRHWSKGAKAAMDRGLGSIELANVARSILAFGRVPGEDGRTAIAVTKHNLCAAAPTVEYRLEPVETTDADGQPWNVVRAVLGEAIEGLSADDLAMSVPEQSAERSAVSEAREVVLAILSDGAEVAAKDLNGQARDAGIASRTLDRVRKTLHDEGRIERLGGGLAGAIRWRLSAIERQSSPFSAKSQTGGERDNLAFYGESGRDGVPAEPHTEWSPRGMVCDECRKVRTVDVTSRLCEDCLHASTIGKGAAA